jgi:hypothetical protein
VKRLVLLLAGAAALSGCYATKIVTVPMRVVGAVGSAIPFVGNAAHDTIDQAADVVDDIGG